MRGVGSRLEVGAALRCLSLAMMTCGGHYLYTHWGWGGGVWLVGGLSWEVGVAGSLAYMLGNDDPWQCVVFLLNCVVGRLAPQVSFWQLGWLTFLYITPCLFGLVWLISHGWKYCWLIWCERKILFIGWKSMAYKSNKLKRTGRLLFFRLNWVTGLC